jgi:peptidoglycan/LPS O-acetylase OafA/YrhL
VSADRAGTKLELSPQFPVLDSLRAVGALAVLTTHTAFQAGEYTRHGFWGTLLSRLDVGVAIFFVLSGFLLARPYLARARLDLPPPATGRYYWKRFLRIYPVYAVTVVIALAFIPENSDFGPLDWVKTLTLSDVYTRNELPYGLTQMWSLAVEAMFYLVLPLLMAIAIGRERQLRPARVLSVGLVATLASCGWHLGWGSAVGDVTGGLPTNWLPGFLAWFAVGIGLALCHVLYQSGDSANGALGLVSTIGRLPGTCWVIVAGLMLVLATPLAGPSLLIVASPSESLAKNLCYALVGGLVVVTGIFPDPAGRYVRLMSTRPLRHLGHLSYSVFCIHLPWLYVVMSFGPYEYFRGRGLEIWLVTLVGSLAAAEVLYRFVEMPGMRLKNLGGRGPSSASHPKTAPSTSTTR